MKYEQDVAIRQLADKLASVIPPTYHSVLLLGGSPEDKARLDAMCSQYVEHFIKNTCPPGTSKHYIDSVRSALTEVWWQGATEAVGYVFEKEVRRLESLFGTGVPAS